MVGLLFVASLTAHAGDRFVDAEHQRLTDEMEQLAQRQAWRGVERQFQDLLALDCEPSEADLLLAAHAARELGDVGAVYERLRRARRLGDDSDVTSWIREIDRRYGDVELFAVPSKRATLEVAELPLDPAERRAISAAVEAARTRGEFKGKLPEGEYVFGGQELVVEPGVIVHLEVPRKARRRGIIDPVIRKPDRPSLRP